MLNVKKDLGSEAVILQTRKFNKGGFMGMFGKQAVEVTAAVEVNTPAGAAQAPRKKAAEPGAPAAPAARKVSSPSPHGGGQIDSLRDEMRQMRDTIKTLVSSQTGAVSRAAENVQPFSAVFGDIYLQLLENDVDVSVAQEIIRSLSEAVPEEDKDDYRVVQSYLVRHLKRLFKISGGIELSAGSPKTVAFVGPTGVGKTTTIAKLATYYTLSRRKKVGLITSDTYRIAAVEQLKVYGEILDIPVRVVYSNEDMKQSLDLFSDRDLILIDTAGRSHRNTEKLYSLKDTLTTHFPLEIHLVVSPGLRMKELMDIAEKFRVMPYNHIVFTKLDEASTYGNILNLAVKLNIGVSYLSYGQNVPDEIRPASYDLLVDLAMGKPLEKTLPAQIG